MPHAPGHVNPIDNDRGIVARRYQAPKLRTSQTGPNYNPRGNPLGLVETSREQRNASGGILPTSEVEEGNRRYKEEQERAAEQARRESIEVAGTTAEDRDRLARQMEGRKNDGLADLLAAKGRGESFASADTAALGEFERARRAMQAQALSNRGGNPNAVSRAEQQAIGQLGRDRITAEAVGARDAQLKALELDQGMQLELDRRSIEILQQGLDAQTTQSLIEQEMRQAQNEATYNYWLARLQDQMQRDITAEQEDSTGTSPSEQYVSRAGANRGGSYGEGPLPGKEVTSASPDLERYNTVTAGEGDAPTSLDKLSDYSKSLNEGDAFTSGPLDSFDKRDFWIPSVDTTEVRKPEKALAPDGSMDTWDNVGKVGSFIADYADPIGDMFAARGGDRNRAAMNLATKAGIHGVGALYEYLRPEKAVDAASDLISGGAEAVAEAGADAAGKGFLAEAAPYVGPAMEVGKFANDPSIKNLAKGGTSIAGTAIGGAIGGIPGAAIGGAVADAATSGIESLMGGSGRQGVPVPAISPEFSVKTSAMDNLEKLKRRLGRA